MKSLYESLLDTNAPKIIMKNATKYAKIKEIFKEYFERYEAGFPIEKDIHTKWNNECICNVEMNMPNNVIDDMDELVKKFKKVTKIEKKYEPASVWHEASYYTIKFPEFVDDKNKPLTICFTYDRHHDSFCVEVIESFIE